MKNYPKILFISDKWCEGNKLFGISEWEIGIQKSLETLRIVDTNVFHLDEHYATTGKKGDMALLQKIRTEKPDMICLITYKMPGTAFNAPDFSTLDEIRDNLKVPIMAIWGDLEINKQVQISKALLPYTTLNLATASSSVIVRINQNDRYLYMWAPRDQRIFNNPNKERDIDISYAGTPKKDRLKKALYLKNYGIKIIFGGGERQEHLTTEQYADRYQRSKIALSFSRASVIHVINARPFEVTLCGAMLLEQESFETMKLYTPYVDYVPYTSKRDMLKKAKYYLEHDEEREKIALSGQRKTEELYSAKRFWEIVIDRALGTNSGEEYKFEYAIPEESLSKLSPFTAFKMKFLNSLCRTSTGVFIYKIFHWRYWQELIYSTLTWFRPLLEKCLPKKLFKSVLDIKRKIY